ncbi:MAG: hypothetical protein Q4D38_06585 [Planctomycetia bacterium]|nr:hypothetical protein [Planctomycetia bacterium]
MKKRFIRTNRAYIVSFLATFAIAALIGCMALAQTTAGVPRETEAGIRAEVAKLFSGWEEDENLVRLPELKEDVLSKLRTYNDAQSNVACDEALKNIVKILKDKDLPNATRLNAMILAGELKVGRPGERDRIEVPFEPARKMLTSALKLSDAYLRVAAMRGLINHAYYLGRNPRMTKECAELALVLDPFAFAPHSETGIDSPEVEWMRLLAIRGLGYLRVDANGRAEKILHIICDKDEYSIVVPQPRPGRLPDRAEVERARSALDVRLTAVEALARMNLNKNSLGKTTTAEAVEAIAKFGAEAVAFEWRQKFVLRRGSESEGMTYVTEDSFNSMDPEVNDLMIRSLMQRVKTVSNVFIFLFKQSETSGILQIANAAEKDRIGKIRKHFETINELYDNLRRPPRPTQPRTKEGEAPTSMEPERRDPQFLGERTRLRVKLRDLYEFLGMDASVLTETTRPTGR